MALTGNQKICLKTIKQTSHYFFPKPHLKISEPYPIVGDMKSQNVIDEWLTFGMISGRSEGLDEQLFNDGVMRLRLERLVERKQRPRRLQTISGHLQLGHRMYVLDEELGGRAFGDVGQPQIQVLLLFHLEISDFIAVLHLADLVDHAHFVLPVHLRVALGMRHHVLEVRQQMARAESDASRRKD